MIEICLNLENALMFGIGCLLTAFDKTHCLFYNKSNEKNVYYRDM